MQDSTMMVSKVCWSIVAVIFIFVLIVRGQLADDTSYVPLHVIHDSDGVLQNDVCPSSDVRNSAHSSFNEEVEELITGRPCRGPGWRRVAFLNMSDSNEQCPAELAETSYSVRTCGRNGPTRNCWSVTYITGGMQYDQVCGRAIAYQYGQNIAFNPSLRDSRLTIEDQYLDGLSITHGAPGSRQHIWSFAVAYFEGARGNGVNSHCPCDSGYRNVYPPRFVRNDYFCESGATYNTRSGTPATNRFYPSDPLWDGRDCVKGDPRIDHTCCEFNKPPWFLKKLDNPTTNDIELRLCSYDTSEYSDVAVQLLEIYVQ